MNQHLKKLLYLEESEQGKALFNQFYAVKRANTGKHDNGWNNQQRRRQFFYIKALIHAGVPRKCYQQKY